MPERIAAIDAARGFAILLVVLGHSIQFNISNPFDNSFFRIIYSFHMPLFIAISGYLAWGHITRNVGYLWKKFTSLIIPFISWYVVGYAGALLISFILEGNIESVVGFNEYVLRWLITAYYGLWFLWVLFLCFVVLFILLRFEQVLGDLAILGTIALLYISYPLHISNAHLELLQWYFPFFSIAYLVAKHRVSLKQWELPMTLISIVAFPLLVVFWQFSAPLTYAAPPTFAAGLPVDGVVLSAFILSYNYATAFTGIIVSITLIRIIQPCDILSWLGKYTMDIYVSSGKFLMFLIIVLAPLSANYLLLKIILCTVMSLVLALALSFFVLRKSKILSFLFLGKNLLSLSRGN